MPLHIEERIERARPFSALGPLTVFRHENQLYLKVAGYDTDLPYNAVRLTPPPVTGYAATESSLVLLCDNPVVQPAAGATLRVSFT